LANSIWRNGTATFDGVQFVDGGQLDSSKSPLVFKDTVLNSKVIDSSFMNCKAFCVHIDKADGVSLTNNVFYNAWVYGVEVS